MSEAPPRVSVVVPVFDPGPYIEPAIASVLAQTLPAGQVEAIFVDDGSTDGTSARLDRLAAEHPATVRVIHIEPSGAPGRPRNIGIEAARGDYIQFLDADDELAREALERVVTMADRNASDVVVEKFASASMPRSQRLFERSVERTTLIDSPALVDSSLGPAKLYRRSFLLANAIRFPEGWRQMEDQAFTIHAYARARSIGVCADQPLYFFNRRDDDGHLTGERVDPERHLRNLRAVLDLVEAETEPGSLRDRIERRMLRVELLNRVSEPGYLALSEDDRARFFAAGRDLVRERISAQVIADLGPVRRLRCELLRDDRPDDLLSLARQLDDLEVTTENVRLDWDEGAVRIRATVGLRYRSSGRTLRLATRGDGDRPVGHPYAVAADAGLIRAQLVLRARPSVLEWYLRTATRARDDRVEATATASIDPQGVGSGGLPLDAGTWDVLVRVTGLGIEWSGPLAAGRPPGPTPALCPALVGDPARVVVAIRGSEGLRLEVDPPPAVVTTALRAGPIRVIADGANLAFDLPMVAGSAAGPLPAALVLGDGDDERLITARLRPRRGRVVLEAAIAEHDRLAPGRHPMTLRVGGSPAGADVPLGTAVIGGDGVVRIDGLERMSTMTRLGALSTWTASRAAKPFGREARRLASTTRRVGRGLVRRIRRTRRR
ncbi:MAG TPA: glycosyltransferase family A protein [Candidatus Limnocylindrales bacterium]|nr:glycosyltransferase family A protein [Candidatus Limnocylindrales bacterium]